MNKALICVDVQHDFLPGGPLGVPNGHQVIRPLIRLMDDADIIVLTKDWHPADHVSFSTTPEFRDGSWPQHCVAGTAGAQIDEELWWGAINTGKPVILVHKGWDKDKEAYSAFDGAVVDTFNRDAFPLLAEEFLWNHQEDRGVTLAEALHQFSVRQVIVGGLALDYCVKATAIDAVPSFNTTVVVRATAGVDTLDSIAAVVRMGESGVRINTWKDV